jgi:hypothetical protein
MSPHHTDENRQSTFVVCCLQCGGTRRTNRTETGHLASPECPTCGYLGWCEYREAPDVAFAL